MILRLVIFFISILVSAFAVANEHLATAHDFSFTSIEGDALPLSRFHGKTILLVNTASQCGFTEQYKHLQTLWTRYRKRGLIVLGVPSNDFGKQEPGKEAEIKKFCEVNFNVDFPLTAKVHVTGARAHPFYKWAIEKLGLVGKPRWNFHKYLIGPGGYLVDWYSTVTSPTSQKVISAIEAQLKQSAQTN